MPSSSPSPTGARKRSKPSRTRTPPFPLLHLFGEPSDAVFPSKPDLLRLLAVVAIAASVASACNFASLYLNRKLKPFCDDALDWPHDACEPCPEHGVCSDGELECSHGYNKLGRRCIKDIEIDQTAEKFSYWIKYHVCEAHAQVLCGGTGKVWFQEEEIMKLFEEHKQKENIILKDGTFALAKKEAMETLQNSLETKIVAFGLKEFKCPEHFAELYKSFLCNLKLWIYQHKILVFCVSLVLVGGVIVLQKMRQKWYLSERAEQLYEQICDILEENSLTAKCSNNKDESWVVYSWLRDHLLSPRERKNMILWKKVDQLVQEDSRIDQYPKLIKGETKVVLEWQVEGSLSANRRPKGKAGTTKISRHEDKYPTRQEQKRLVSGIME